MKWPQRQSAGAASLPPRPLSRYLICVPALAASGLRRSAAGGGPLATVAGDEREQGDVAGALDRDRYLSLDPGRVAGAPPRQDLAPVVEAAPQPGDVLVVDHLVVVEDRLLPASRRPTPAAAWAPAPAAAPFAVPTAKAAATAAGAAPRSAGTSWSTGSTGAARPAKAGAWLLAAVSFLIAGFRHSWLRSRLCRLVAARCWRKWARRPERGIVHRTVASGDSTARPPAGPDLAPFTIMVVPDRRAWGLGGVMAAEANGYGNDGPIVSVEWLMEHRADPNLVVIDPRPAHEYAAAHLPGAVHLDVYQPELKVRDSHPAERDRFIAAVARALANAGVRFDPGQDGDEPSQRVVFAEAVSGTLAARGVWILDLLGHGGGAMLDGGLHAWINAGGELTRTVPEVAPERFTPAPDYDLLAGADEIREAIAGDGPGRGAMTVLDTRARMEYASGTIPTAVHLEWTANLDANGALRPPEQLLPLYAEAGLDPEDERPVVAFCGSGYRAAHSYVVLKALGFPRVSNYAPSWGEWGRRPDLPTEQPDQPRRH